MTFDTERSIPFRLGKLLSNLDTLKVNRKEFISISKVLIKLAREDEKVREFTEVIFSPEKNYYELFGLDEDFLPEQLNNSFDLVVASLQRKSGVGGQNGRVGLRLREKVLKETEYLKTARDTLLSGDRRKLYDRKLEIQKKVRKNFSPRDFSDWKSTMKEKNLLFTLKVIAEIRQKGFNYTVGVDFNNSETHNFKFVDGKMLIPFLAITGIGEALANKLIAYRENYCRINYWKDDLKGILNKKHFEQFLDLEENNLLFN